MNMKLPLLLAALAMSAPLAHAAGIDWGNNAFGGTADPNTNLYMYNSSGGLLDNTFSFELGTWVSGFTPTAANVNLWAANWKVLSTAYAPGANGWASLDPSDPNVNDPNQNPEYFSKSLTFNTNGTVQGGGSSIFTTNEQAYVWVYNSKSITSTTEWALVTDISLGATPDDVWHVPDPSQSLGFPVLWNLSSADTAVFGEVNGVIGAGNQTVDPGPNSLQTFNVVSPVPEPGSAALLLLAGAALHTRRRSRGKT